MTMICLFFNIWRPLQLLHTGLNNSLYKHKKIEVNNFYEPFPLSMRAMDVERDMAG